MSSSISAFFMTGTRLQTINIVNKKLHQTWIDLSVDDYIIATEKWLWWIGFENCALQRTNDDRAKKHTAH